jgi:hypothetical protein
MNSLYCPTPPDNSEIQQSAATKTKQPSPPTGNLFAGTVALSSELRYEAPQTLHP